MTDENTEITDVNLAKDLDLQGDPEVTELESINPEEFLIMLTSLLQSDYPQVASELKSFYELNGHDQIWSDAEELTALQHQEDAEDNV